MQPSTWNTVLPVGGYKRIAEINNYDAIIINVIMAHFFFLFVLSSAYFSILFSIFPQRLLLYTIEYFVFLLYCILFIIILCFSPAAGLLQQTNFSNGRINKVVSKKHKRPQYHLFAKLNLWFNATFSDLNIVHSMCVLAEFISRCMVVYGCGLQV